MSWGNENEEIRSLKKAISSKGDCRSLVFLQLQTQTQSTDALYATLESELLKRTTQFNDIKNTLNETISKVFDTYELYFLSYTPAAPIRSGSST